MRITGIQKRGSKNTGLTLIEMLISTTMFFLMITLLFGSYKAFMTCWRSAEAKDEVHRKFIRVSTDFQREIVRTDIDKILCGVTACKSWICFPSNVDTEGKPYYDYEGYPIWKKFILYYTIRPTDDHCISPIGLIDDICPHKYMIRKDVDIMANLSNEDAIRPYLTFTLTAQQAASESGVLYAKPIADDIIDIKGHIDSVRIYMQLKILRINEASRKYDIGLISLSTAQFQPYINDFLWSIIPRNKEP